MPILPPPSVFIPPAKKKLFLFTGDDSSSDNGYYEATVRAEEVRRARVLFKKYMAKNGKLLLCLGNEASCTEIPGDEDGVVHSTLQS